MCVYAWRRMEAYLMQWHKTRIKEKLQFFYLLSTLILHRDFCLKYAMMVAVAADETCVNYCCITRSFFLSCSSILIYSSAITVHEWVKDTHKNKKTIADLYIFFAAGVTKNKVAIVSHQKKKINRGTPKHE